MLNERLYQLNTLVLCDVPPNEMPDAFYVYSEPASFLDLLGGAALDLAKSRKIKIAICGGVGRGYDFRLWLKLFRDAGIKEDNIVLIAPPEEEIDCWSESVKLARHAKMFGWKNIWITAPPYQQTRAFMSLVSALSKEFFPTKVYNKIALPLNWHKDIIHYRGEVKGAPLNFIQTELDAIGRAVAAGDLLPADQILKYLEERE